MNAVDVKNLNFTWRNSVHQTEALRNVTFGVAENQILSIIGPSGAGKSSLLHILAGLEFPTSGTCVFRGEPISGPSSERGLIFQSANLFPWLNVLDNVSFGPKMRGMGKLERHRAAMNVLSSVGLGAWANRLPSELSGGMAQRVAIARALCNEPSLLLMDEPFASVDLQTRQVLGQFVLEVWEKYQKTLVMVTHSLDEAIQLSDVILVFSASPGRVLDEIQVGLPRPRDTSAKSFLDIRRHIGSILEKEVKMQFESESLLA